MGRTMLTMNLPTEEDAAEAIKVGERFWTALADDDDETLEGMLSGNALGYLGAHPGLAHRLREHMDVTPAKASFIGTVSPFEILEDGRLRLSYTPVASTGRRLEPSEEYSGWRIEFEKSEGAWLVDPIRPHDTPAIGTATFEVH